MNFHLWRNITIVLNYFKDSALINCIYRYNYHELITTHNLGIVLHESETLTVIFAFQWLFSPQTFRCSLNFRPLKSQHFRIFSGYQVSVNLQPPATFGISEYFLWRLTAYAVKVNVLSQPLQTELDSVDLGEVSIVTTIWPCSTGITFFRLVELVKCFVFCLLRLDWFKRLLQID